jgi:hypothetical protein
MGGTVGLGCLRHLTEASHAWHSCCYFSTGYLDKVARQSACPKDRSTSEPSHPPHSLMVWPMGLFIEVQSWPNGVFPSTLLVPIQGFVSDALSPGSIWLS